jgi:flavin reductase (DIM6/NTAB) family NADH-FMN oxidoreductase RutF
LKSAAEAARRDLTVWQADAAHSDPKAGSVTIPPPMSTASAGTGPALNCDGNALNADGNALSPDVFRRAMGRHPAGVVIVTVAGPSGPGGLTVTSFSSASLDPPLVSFYIGHVSSNWPAIRDARHFAVNLIGEAHQSLAHRFARKDEDRFAPPTRWHRGRCDLPLLTDATTHLICATDTLVTVGDHELVVGRVLEAAFGRSDRPLLHHQGRFTRPEAGRSEGGRPEGGRTEACRQRVARR